MPPPDTGLRPSRNPLGVEDYSVANLSRLVEIRNDLDRQIRERLAVQDQRGSCLSLVLSRSFVVSRLRSPNK